MSFWLREIVGWALLALGLWLFLEVYDKFRTGGLFAAMTLAVVGVFVFRSGVNMLRTAIAARMCKAADERLYAATKPERRR